MTKGGTRNQPLVYNLTDLWIAVWIVWIEGKQD